MVAQKVSADSNADTAVKVLSEVVAPQFQIISSIDDYVDSLSQMNDDSGSYRGCGSYGNGSCSGSSSGDISSGGGSSSSGGGSNSSGSSSVSSGGGRSDGSSGGCSGDSRASGGSFGSGDSSGNRSDRSSDSLFHF